MDETKSEGYLQKGKVGYTRAGMRASFPRPTNIHQNYYAENIVSLTRTSDMIIRGRF